LLITTATTPILVDDYWVSNDAAPHKVGKKAGLHGIPRHQVDLKASELDCTSAVAPDQRVAEFRRLYKFSSIFSWYIQRELYWIAI